MDHKNIEVERNIFFLLERSLSLCWNRTTAVSRSNVPLSSLRFGSDILHWLKTKVMQPNGERYIKCTFYLLLFHVRSDLLSRTDAFELDGKNFRVCLSTASITSYSITTVSTHWLLIVWENNSHQVWFILWDSSLRAPVQTQYTQSVRCDTSEVVVVY